MIKVLLAIPSICDCFPPQQSMKFTSVYISCVCSISCSVYSGTTRGGGFQSLERDVYGWQTILQEIKAPLLNLSLLLHGFTIHLSVWDQILNIKRLWFWASSDWSSSHFLTTNWHRYFFFQDERKILIIFISKYLLKFQVAI